MPRKKSHTKNVTATRVQAPSKAHAKENHHKKGVTRKHTQGSETRSQAQRKQTKQQTKTPGEETQVTTETSTRESEKIRE